jgi:hypothetical protein
MDEVMNLLERVYEDGVVTPAEHDELMKILKKNFLSGGGRRKASNASTTPLML